jgi:hypothetical protein
MGDADRRNSIPLPGLEPWLIKSANDKSKYNHVCYSLCMEGLLIYSVMNDLNNAISQILPYSHITGEESFRKDFKVLLSCLRHIT